MAARKKAGQMSIDLEETEDMKPGMSKSEITAKAVTKYPVLAAESMKRLVSSDDEIDLSHMIRALQSIEKDVVAGSLSHLEKMLATQATVLDALFHHLILKGFGCEYQRNFENVLKLAFKAQSQARCTAEALALLKNPQPYIRQANIAQQQQVNNSYAPMPEDTAEGRGEEIKTVPNKVLEVVRGDNLECGKAAATSPDDSAMATLAAVNGA